MRRRPGWKNRTLQNIDRLNEEIEYERGKAADEGASIAVRLARVKELLDKVKELQQELE